MPQQSPNPITVELTNQLLTLLNNQFWYAPDAATLTYQNKSLHSLDMEMHHRYDNDFSIDNLWVFGSPSSDDITEQGAYGIAMGGAGHDNIEGVGGGFFWGGSGRDNFRVVYDPKTKTIKTTILDLTKNDSLFVDIGTATQKQFNLALSNIARLYGKKTGKLSFGIDMAEKVFKGSQYDEFITGTERASSIDGGGGNDTISGSEYSDTIKGGDGDDELSGSGGRDIFWGGTGRDIFTVEDGDRVMDASAEDTIIVTGLKDRYDNSKAKVIYFLDHSSGATKTTLKGGNWNDTFYGSGRGDLMIGGKGADRFHVGRNDSIQDLAADDTVIIASIDAALRKRMITACKAANAKLIYEIYLSITHNRSTSLEGGSLNDTLYGSNYDDTLMGLDGNDNIDGWGGDDALHGGRGNDTLNGGDGNDTLFGDDGDDILISDLGNNEMHGGNGNDTLTGGIGNELFFGDAGNDVLNGMSGNDTLIGSKGRDTLSGGSGDDALDGGDDDDVLMGGAGADTLHGGKGNDMLVGGSGLDELWGDDGDDRFVFTPTQNGVLARIMDFESGNDTIDLSAFSLMKGYNESTFRSGIKFDAKSNRLTIDANADGVIDVTIDFLGTSQFKLSSIVLNNLYGAKS